MCLHTLFVEHKQCGHVSVAPQMGMFYTGVQYCEAVLAWMKVYHDQPNQTTFDIPLEPPRPCPLSIPHMRLAVPLAQTPFDTRIEHGSLPNFIAQWRELERQGFGPVLCEPGGCCVYHTAETQHCKYGPEQFPPRYPLRTVSNDAIAESNALAPYLGYWEAGHYLLRTPQHVAAIAIQNPNPLVTTGLSDSLCPICNSKKAKEWVHLSMLFDQGWRQVIGPGFIELAIDPEKEEEYLGNLRAEQTNQDPIDQPVLLLASSASSSTSAATNILSTPAETPISSVESVAESEKLEEDPNLLPTQRPMRRNRPRGRGRGRGRARTQANRGSQTPVEPTPSSNVNSHPIEQHLIVKDSHHGKQGSCLIVVVINPPASSQEAPHDPPKTPTAPESMRLLITDITIPSSPGAIPARRRTQSDACGLSGKDYRALLESFGYPLDSDDQTTKE